MDIVGIDISKAEFDTALLIGERVSIRRVLQRPGRLRAVPRLAGAPSL